MPPRTPGPKTGPGDEPGPGLRERAESLLDKSRTQATQMPDEDVAGLLHELQVYHTELELQNEELRRAQLELAESRDRYVSLYHDAPVGYVTLDEDARVLEANRVAAQMLGIGTAQLIGAKLTDFIARDAQDTFYIHRRAALTNEKKQACEIRMLAAGGSRPFPVDMEILPRIAGAAHELRTVIIDVGELHTARARRDASERRLRSLIAALPHGVFEVDTNGRITFTNEAGANLFGYPVDELVGKHTYELLATGAKRRALKQYVARLVRDQPPPSPFLGPHKRKNGDIIEVQIDWDYRRDADERLMGFICVATDVSARVRAEERLKASNEDLARQVAERTAALDKSVNEFRALADSVPACFSYLDTEQRYRYVNRAFQELFRRSARACLGRKAGTILGAKGYRRAAPHILKALDGERARFELELETADGRAVFDCVLVPDFDAARAVVGVFMLANDVTELTSTRRALQRQGEQMREMMGRLIDAQERQARMIARDLHDVFGQELAAVNLGLAGLERAVAAHEQTASSFRKLRDRIGQLGEDLHKLSRQLHPSIVHDLGIVAALERECALFAEQHGIPVAFSADEIASITPDAAVALYRITQEALRNIGRHAQAQEVTVTLQVDDGMIVLTMADVGNGFDIAYANRKGGLGLVSMEERAALLGGSVDVRSEPGVGTTVKARIPLDSARRPVAEGT